MKLVVNRALGVLAGVAFVWIVALTLMYQHERRRVHEIALQRDSVEAVADTTRLVLADSLLTYQRRAVQAQEKADALDVKLRQTTAAKVSTVVTLPVLRQTVQADSSTRTDTSQVLHFTAHQPPVQVEAVVTVPTTGPASAAFLTKVDPFALTVRVACGNQARDGVRPALVEAQTVPGINIRIDEAQQAPGVCNPTPARSWTPPLVKAGALLVVVGVAGKLLHVF